MASHHLNQPCRRLVLPLGVQHYTGVPKDTKLLEGSIPRHLLDTRLAVLLCPVRQLLGLTIKVIGDLQWRISVGEQEAERPVLVEVVERELEALIEGLVGRKLPTAINGSKLDRRRHRQPLGRPQEAGGQPCGVLVGAMDHPWISPEEDLLQQIRVVQFYCADAGAGDGDQGIDACDGDDNSSRGETILPRELLDTLVSFLLILLLSLQLLLLLDDIRRIVRIPCLSARVARA
mmetsp:Transcript_14296/g.48897  ORF Transcript_14296/g.48897 Transcript_14296/m.48897 type:complete len:233 (+) Transcript_14296:2104-2802(+)